jgi:hypothetical protein
MAGMDVNPYESPQGRSERPDQTRYVLLKVVGGIAWTLSLLPAAPFLLWLIYHPGGDAEDDLTVSTFTIFPSIGLAFLGAACWWRTIRYALVGLFAFVPLLVLLLFPYFWKMFLHTLR